MADVGTIGTRRASLGRSDNSSAFAQGAVTIGRLGRNLLGPNHKITGTTSVDGVVVPHRRVWLVERATGRLLADTFSNAAGVFEFGNLWSGDGAKYLVYMTADPRVDPVRNAVIFDFVAAAP